jgi:hypothetical protein
MADGRLRTAYTGDDAALLEAEAPFKTSQIEGSASATIDGNGDAAQHLRR